MNLFISKVFLKNTLFITIFLFVHVTHSTFGQYAKNPIMPITNDGYNMTVEKYVKIPDDNGNRPRINTFTYYGDRIFVATEVGGKIYEIIKNGSLYKAVLFFDVATAIYQKTGRNMNTQEPWHGGLRSVAFHPEFSTNGKFYTTVMEDRPSDISNHKYLSDDPNAIQADGVLLEWTYDLESNTVIASSYRELFRVGMADYGHTIREIKFNHFAKPGDEDYGLLYITHGDGSEQSATAGGGQRNDALGKILRIDPLQSGEDAYTIPSTNPFVNDDAWLDEIYSLGHRNPHTICFGKDDFGNVHIIVGETGRDNMEEVNIIKKGGDYGWSGREGTYVHLSGGGIKNGIAALPSNDVTKGYIYPSAQWTHTGSVGAGFVGQAIAGGYVYTTPSTNEKLYLCSDFAVSGRVFHINLNELTSAFIKLDPDDINLDDPKDLTQAHIGELNVFFDHDRDLNTVPIAKTSMKDIINDESNYDPTDSRADLRFGQDKDDHVYIMSKRNGWIYKIQSIITTSKAPVLATIEVTPLRYTEGSAIITGTLTITHEDNTKLSKATVKITGNYKESEDKLVYTNANGITGVWTASTGTLSLTGSATVAAYQTSLRSITYQNTNDIDPSTLNRKVSFTVNDGSLNSNSVDRTIEVTINTGLYKYENAQFSAYPNPVSKDDVLRLSFTKAPTQAIDIIAVNIEGRKWNLGKTIPGDKNIEINLREKNLSSGFFIIHIDSGDTRVAYPVVIK